MCVYKIILSVGDLLKICLFFYLAMPQSLQDLSSITRDQNSAVDVQSPTPLLIAPPKQWQLASKVAQASFELSSDWLTLQPHAPQAVSAGPTAVLLGSDL